MIEIRLKLLSVTLKYSRCFLHLDSAGSGSGSELFVAEAADPDVSLTL